MSEIQFDHIAIAAHRMADAPAVLVGALGGAPTGDGGPSGSYTWGQWGFAGGGRLEILEPLGAGGFLHRFLATRGPGIHHVTFQVPRLDQACRRAVAYGFRLVGHDDSDPGWAEAFLHPKEARRRVRRIRPRPSPCSASGRARSEERAETLWGAVLGGRRDGARGGPVYRWPGSPMRITVDVDAGAEEGPLAIEFSSPRPVSLPDPPHPTLGTSFWRNAP